MGSSPHVRNDLQPLASAPRKRRVPRGVMTELLGANTDTLDRIGESLRTDARRMQDIRNQAQRAVAELAAGWIGSDLWHLTQQWEQQTSPCLLYTSPSPRD